MAAKQYYLILDVETSITDKVVDFGAVVCDRNGEIATQCAVLVNNVFGVESLFFNKQATDIWSQASVVRRMETYNNMLHTGTRMLASVNAINRWLEKVAGKFNPELTAYNLAFDNSKCANTEIDLTMFKNRFCLWHASVGNICNTKKYKEFIIQNHLINNRTEKGNQTFSTTAEAVTGYLTGNMTDEPHTALEDIIGYELPTLVHIVKKKGWRDKLIPYDWNKHQVKNHFQAK